MDPWQLINLCTNTFITKNAIQDYGCPDEAKSVQLVTPSQRGDSRYRKDDGFHNVNENHDVSSKATIASKQSCMPKTRITNLDLILSQMSRMRNQISSGIVQPPIGAEPSDRWLKRLQLDISDPDIPGSKRPKIGDSPPLGQTIFCLAWLFLATRLIPEWLVVPRRTRA